MTSLSPIGKTPLETILLVEDDAVLRRCLRFALAKESYRVEEATSVEEATGLALANSFSLIVTDYDLGSGPDGLSLLAQMRRRHTRIPIILMSGGYGSWLGPAARDLGAASFLQKPFALEVFLHAIGQALNPGSA